MNAENTRSFAKKKSLCFYCLKEHCARDCSEKRPCSKCQRRHSDFLHQERQKISVTTSGNNNINEVEGKKEIKTEVSTSRINTARYCDQHQIPNEAFVASVPLIALTTVKQSNSSSVEVPFFALVDTGADSTICTRELAEILYEWDPRGKISSWKRL